MTWPLNNIDLEVLKNGADDPAWGQIYAINVHPKWCAQGAGSALFAGAEGRLVSLGYDKAFLWVEVESEKSKRLLCERVAVVGKYEFINSQRTSPFNTNSVTEMCRWLSVSTSGFYHWLRRPKSATVARLDEPTARIENYFKVSDQTYGYRRIHADLMAEGT